MNAEFYISNNFKHNREPVEVLSVNLVNPGEHKVNIKYKSSGKMKTDVPANELALIEPKLEEPEEKPLEVEVTELDCQEFSKILKGLTVDISEHDKVKYQSMKDAEPREYDVVKKHEDGTLDLEAAGRKYHNVSPASIIKPDHYRKGKGDLFDSWYIKYPFPEFRTAMATLADRYINRVKESRVTDLDKAIYVLKRLKEYEIKEIENDA